MLILRHTTPLRQSSHTTTHLKPMQANMCTTGSSMCPRRWCIGMGDPPNRSLHSISLNLQHWKTEGQDPLHHLHLATRPQCLISRSERALTPLLLVAPSRVGQHHRDRTTLTMELTQATTDLSAGTRITQLEVTTTTKIDKISLAGTDANWIGF